MSYPTAHAPGMLSSPAGDAGPETPLLILAWNYPPDNAAASPRPYLLAKYLRQFGYASTVITAARQDSCTADVHYAPDRLAFSHKVVRKLLLPGACALGWIRPAIAAARQLLADKRCSLILSTSPPVASHYAALALKGMYGLRWVADLQDPISGNPARAARAYPYLDAIAERPIFRYADALIANTDAVAAMWKRRYPRWAAKTDVLWNGFDPEEAVRAAPIPARGFRVLAHVGAVSSFRPPSLMLRSLDRVTGRELLDPAAVRVRLLGHLTDYNEDSALVSSLNAKGVLEVLPPVTLAEARRATAEADYLLLLDIISGNTGLQVPSKILDYVRIGRPILALTTRNSPVDRILSQSGVRYISLYPDLPEEEFDRRVLELFRLPTEPLAASQWFRETFSAVNHARTLASILDRVRGARVSIPDPREPVLERR